MLVRSIMDDKIHFTTLTLNTKCTIRTGEITDKEAKAQKTKTR